MMFQKTALTVTDRRTDMDYLEAVAATNGSRADNQLRVPGANFPVMDMHSL